MLLFCALTFPTVRVLVSQGHGEGEGAGKEAINVSNSWPWLAGRALGAWRTPVLESMGPLRVISLDLGSSPQQTCINSNCGAKCNQTPAFIFSTWGLGTTEKLRSCTLALTKMFENSPHQTLSPIVRHRKHQLLSSCQCLLPLHRSLVADWDAWLGSLPLGTQTLCLAEHWLPGPQVSSPDSSSFSF